MDFYSITKEDNRSVQNILKDGLSMIFGIEAAEVSSNNSEDGHQKNSVADEGNHFWPVAALESGDGLPYAPIDWPNPGDTWAWRVGRRVGKAGYYVDRFLYPPWKIVPIGSPKFFASKSACQQFLKSNFPEKDHEAFFASFSWKIPAKSIDSPKVTRENGEAMERRVSQRGRKITSSYVEEEGDVGGSESVDIQGKSIEEECRVNKRGRKVKSSYIEKEDDDVEVIEPKLKRKSDEKAGLGSSSELSMDNFEKYFDSIEELLTPRNPVCTSDSHSEGTSVIGPELVMARAKLSLLLTLGFPSLASNEIAQRVKSLVSEIRKDTNLTANQLVTLKLVDGLPWLSETYREARKIIEEVEAFFRSSENNILTAVSVRNDYIEIKEKGKELQELVDAGMRAEKEIGEEIEVLRSKLREIGRTIERNKSAREEVVSIERMLARSLHLLVPLIQMSNSVVNEMEAKRKAAVKQEAEIIEKIDKLQKAFH